MRAFFGSLAQLVEQRTFNPLVAGSSPARPTTNLRYQIKALRVIVTPFFVSAAVRSSTYCAVLVTRSSPSTTAACRAMCAGAKCAYRRTIAADFQPPISCTSYNGVPFWIRQLAQVCRRSCQRKSVMLARFSALREAFVFTYLIGCPCWQPKEKCRTRSSARLEINQAEQYQHAWRKFAAMSLPIGTTAQFLIT